MTNTYHLDLGANKQLIISSVSLKMTPLNFKVTTFADRPGYERTSSSLWKQREEYCASLIQKAWKVHKVRATGAVTKLDLFKLI